MKSLKLSKDLSLPVDAVTQTIGILARKRAGKSFTARRFAEQLFNAGQQIVIADPKGDWWGIRSSADGKSKGLPVIIFGGEHADVPLEPTQQSGELVAKLVVEERVSVLLDMGQMRKGEMRTFMTAFLETMYRLKAQDKYRTPMMFIMDEADMFCPQRPMQDEARMLGAVDDIVRRGGQRGIGCVFASQRSAVINKNILSQLQILISLRTISPQDLAALDAWIENHGTPEQRKILMDSLPSLPIGTAWVWSPGWPDDEGIFQRVKILPIETFDSGATPKAGHKQIVPKTIADIDLTLLRKQMAEVVEKAEKTNPVALQRRIATLEKELRASNLPKKSDGSDHIGDSTKLIERAILARDKEWNKTLDVWKNRQAKFVALFNRLEEIMDASKSIWSDFPSEPTKTPVVNRLSIAPKPVVKPSERVWAREEEVADSSGLTNPEQRVLNAIAWCESIGLTKPSNEITAFLSGYSHPKSTGYTNPRGYLKSKGLVEYLSGSVFLTEGGRKLAETPTTPLTQEELHRVVLDRLDNPERRLLKPLLERYPEGISNAELCQLAGYTHEKSTGYTNPRGRLRSFGLVDYGNGSVVARDILFLQ